MTNKMCCVFVAVACTALGQSPPVLTVQGVSGKTVALSAADLAKLPQLLRRDGKPLPDKAGPFQLVAPGEKRGARWVRQVQALRVKQAN